jgi:hypothetical protein
VVTEQPEPRATGLIFNLQPTGVACQQFVHTMTATQLIVARLLTVSIDWSDVNTPVYTAHVVSLANSYASYAVRENYWIVVGPGFEAVYPPDQFATLFTVVAANKITASIGRTTDQPLTAILSLFGNAAGIATTVDWGDGTTPTAATSVAGVLTLTHDYTADGTYTVTVSAPSVSVTIFLTYVADSSVSSAAPMGGIEDESDIQNIPIEAAPPGYPDEAVEPGHTTGPPDGVLTPVIYGLEDTGGVEQGVRDLTAEEHEQIRQMEESIGLDGVVEE